MPLFGPAGCGAPVASDLRCTRQDNSELLPTILISQYSPPKVKLPHPGSPIRLRIMLNNDQQILRRVHPKVPNRTPHVLYSPLPRLDAPYGRGDLRKVQRALALGLREDVPVELPDAPSAHRDVLLRGPGERLPRGLAPAEDGEAVGGGQGAGGAVLHAGDGELDFVVRVHVVVDDRLEEGADLDV